MAGKVTTQTLQERDRTAPLVVPVASENIVTILEQAKRELKSLKRSFTESKGLNLKTASKINDQQSFVNELSQQLQYARATEAERDETAEVERLHSESDRLLADYDARLTELYTKVKDVITLAEELQQEVNNQNSTLRLVRDGLRARGESMAIPTLRDKEGTAPGVGLAMWQQVSGALRGL